MKPIPLFTGAAALAAMTLLLAGCGNPESAVRQRAQAYTQCLIEDNYDKAVDYFDPDVVARRGRTGVAGSSKTIVGIVKGLIQLGGRKPAGFEVRKVDLDAAKERATVQVVFFTTDAKGADRKEHPTDQKWVLKNKTWYATE